MELERYKRLFDHDRFISCDIPEAWEGLVLPLLEYCLEHDYKVCQIKEKFGGLRFYSQGDDTLYDMISEAEEKSYTICESCGKKGETKSFRGWLKTLCEACRKDYEEGR